MNYQKMEAQNSVKLKNLPVRHPRQPYLGVNAPSTGLAGFDKPATFSLISIFGRVVFNVPKMTP